MKQSIRAKDKNKNYFLNFAYVHAKINCICNFVLKYAHFYTVSFPVFSGCTLENRVGSTDSGRPIKKRSS